MSSYEKLLILADDRGLQVFENVDFNSPINGLIVDDNIALSNKLNRESEKLCVLAEEIAHSFVNDGNIIDDPYEENKAHRYAIDLIISVRDVIQAVIELREEATISTVADRLGVTERFLKESLELYSKRFIGKAKFGKYSVSFNPLHVWIEEEN